MTRLDPVRSPVLDTLLAHRRPIEPFETPARQSTGSWGWLRLALTGLLSLVAVLGCRFPAWAVLVLPTAALATQAVRRWRWPFRAACSAVLATYAAQVMQLALTTWAFRFGASFALFMAAAFFWGLRMDEFN